MPPSPRQRVAEHESDCCPEYSDQQTLAIKICRTWRFARAHRHETAMSRVFSITIMMSEMRMLSAATNTISPMVMNVTRRSSFKARKRLCSAPSS